jgi:dihydroorotase
MSAMLARIVLRNVRLFDPGAGVDFPKRTVVIEGDKVLSVDAPDSAQGDHVIYARGRLLVPGFIDLRAHLCEPGHTRRETIATGTKAAARGGFTTVVALPTTSPTIDRVEVVQLILARAAAAGPTRVLPAGAFSVGRQGERLAEMASLMEAGCVAFTDADRSIKDSQLLRYGLELAGELGVTVMTHAEDESLSLGGLMHEGLVAARLGLRGAPGAAEVVGVSRDLAIAELTGARLHLAHVSTAGAVDLIRQAKSRGVHVTADVNPHHLMLTDDALHGYDTMAKIQPPLRPRHDVDALIAALADGTIDAIASDHCPQIDLEKNVEMDRAAPGAIGLEHTLGVALALVKEKKLTLERAITSLTRAPAIALNRPDLGRIEEGGHADLVLLDLEREWTLEMSELVSKSHNTPLLGHTFRGRPVLTIAGGQITHEAA